MASSVTTESLTCCAPTPPGVGAIAVIALRGEAAWSVIRDCVSRPNGALPNTAQPCRLYFGVFNDTNEPIDDVILAPQFTKSGSLVGVDISSHGGIRVVERILMTLTARGAQLISSDAIDPNADWPERIKSQALQRMTRMTTRRAALFMLAQSERLPSAYAQILNSAQRADIEDAQRKLRRLVDQSKRVRHVFCPARISLVGPPNAGKSSLINALSGRDDIVVTDLAGTTRDWVTVPVSIMGVEVTLIDTAGLRDAPDPLEDIAITRGQSKSDDSDLRIWVFDGSRPPPKLELRECDLVVLNKSDLALDDAWPSFVSKWVGEVSAVSAITGAGLDALRTVVGTRLGFDQLDDSAPAEFDPQRLQRLSELCKLSQDSHTSLAGAIHEILAIG